MTRSEFLKMSALLGIGLPIQGALLSCGDKQPLVPFKGKVLIIGAGAGGLSAGYLFQQLGVEYEILEASNSFGGRMRINTNFADFPIPLGAEWLETNTSIFQDIVNDDSIAVSVETVPDAPDRKFVNSSWFNFFEAYILPSVEDRITFNTVVSHIDYSGSRVLVNTQNGQLVADRVVVSVPVKILQDGDITFNPNLPSKKREAINEVTIWSGFKAFIEFSDQFYADNYEFNINPLTAGQKIYYNAALGQNTNKNILGLFVVGAPALDFTSRSGEDLKNFILNELDSIYNGLATANYIQHIAQNWNEEPFIKAGYISDHANWRTVKKLGESVADKIYFAGGAYTDGEDWVSVHTAAQSARRAYEEINA